MPFEASIVALTDAALPVLSARTAAVYLAAGGVLGGVIALLSHLSWIDTRREAWRRLRFVGLVLAPTALAQAVFGGAYRELNPFLVAAFSVLDLSLLTLAVRALFGLFDGDDARLRQRLVAGTVIGAVFLGLIGGDSGRPLLASNAPAAFAHLGSLAIVTALLLLEMVRGLRRGRDRAETRNQELSAVSQNLTDEAGTLRTERDEALARASGAVDLARDAGRRARLLERLIASTADLHGRRGQQDLYDHTAALVSQMFDFDGVVLYQWSESLTAFTVQAAVGVDEAERTRLAAQHTDRVEFDRIAQPRYRVSDSYLIPPPTVAWPPTEPVEDMTWPEGQRLLVTLTDRAGVVHGYLELARPASGRAPDLLRIRYLELFARQLALTLEVGDLRDRMATCRTELAQADERLQALSELRSNFVANVSHELRTPLTSIIGYSEMLRDRGDEMSAEMRAEFLDVIHDQGQQFREIINDLLDLERMEDTSAHLERTECDLAALIRRLAEDWRQRAATSGVDLLIDCSQPEVLLEVDPVLCQQLVSHLVDNALKFTGERGAVRVRVAEQGTAVRLEVQDTGIGIPEEKLHTIFEQFYQVDGSSTREVGGQGVGLSICQDIVSWHDGRIWAENVSGGGARFTVILPRRPLVVLPEPPAALNPVFHDPRLYLQRLIHWVGENLGVRTVVMLQVEPSRDHLTVLAATGMPAGHLQGLRLTRGGGLAGLAWQDGATRLEAPVQGDILLSGNEPALCVPLTLDGDEYGVVVVRERLDGRPLGDDDQALLEAMAPRLAHLLQRHEQHGTATRNFAAIQTSLRVTTRVGTLRHADVAGICHEICLATARRLDLPADEIRHLAFALQYYDVGLGSVPPYVLHKVDALSDAERAQLERHVQSGLVTLAPLEPPPKVRQLILHHHENYDGSGYPKGLAGEAIPLGSRLIALTDSLRALLQRRPWRPPVPLADALAEIQALAGTRYCPRLTSIFLVEAERRRKLVEELRQRADDGEDLKRPAPLHPAQILRN